MTICIECQLWLAQCLRQTVFELEAGNHKAGSEHTFKYFTDRSSVSVHSSRLSCLLCARIWTWLRILSEPLDRLMTDDEVLYSQGKQQGLIAIALERVYRSGTLAEKGGSRIRFNINGTGKGPVFQIVDESRSRSRSASRGRRGSLANRDLIYQEDAIAGYKVVEKKPKYTPLVIRKLESRTNTNDYETPQLIGGSRLALVQRWLDECTHKHISCKEKWKQSRMEGYFLPTRLINVGQNDKQVKIVYSSNFAQWRDIRYATLSHCWGEEAFLTLTNVNHDEFLKHLPVEKLGKTFQETLLLCRALHIRYLWIDSFCIVQDSHNGADWRREAPKMHDIYGHSYLNIAASASTRCTQGLYRPFSDAFAEAISIALPDRRKVVESAEASPSTLLGQHWLRSPLHTRGWVAQELFLSQRILHFTDVQMYWECVRGIESESGIGGGGGNTEMGPSWKFHSVGKSSNELEQLWRQVATHYSGTRVTFAADKMMALAGLAANTSNFYRRLRVPTAYLAGCWRHTLLQWLLWAPNSILQQKMPNFSLPSWSWLSFGNKVYFDDSLLFFSSSSSSPSSSPSSPTTDNDNTSSSSTSILSRVNSNGVVQLTEVLRIDTVHTVLEDPEIPFGSVHTAQIRANSSFFRVVVQVNDILSHRVAERSPLCNCRVEPMQQQQQQQQQQQKPGGGGGDRDGSDGGDNNAATAAIVRQSFYASYVNVWIDHAVRSPASSVAFDCVYVARQSYPTGTSYFGLLVQPLPGSEDADSGGGVAPPATKTYERCGLFKLWVDGIERDEEERRAAQIIGESERERREFILL